MIEDQDLTKKTKVPAYTDLDPRDWREYPDVEVGSLWLFGSREKGNGHSLDYHGNFIPQVANQLMTRYSKAGDIVLDMFLGSGTTAIEALNMGRRCVGIEIQRKMADHVMSKLPPERLGSDVRVICGDSTSEETAGMVRTALSEMGEDRAQLLILHPPYWDIIKFSENDGDISNAGTADGFLEKFKQVSDAGFGLLENGRFAGLVIGDKYAGGELVPLGFLCMQQMQASGFKLRSIIVKNIEGNEKAKGRTNNLWRYRALAGGFYIFKHEYIMLFQKPAK